MCKPRCFKGLKLLFLATHILWSNYMSKYHYFLWNLNVTSLFLHPATDPTENTEAYCETHPGLGAICTVAVAAKAMCKFCCKLLGCDLTNRRVVFIIWISFFILNCTLIPYLNFSLLYCDIDRKNGICQWRTGNSPCRAGQASPFTYRMCRMPWQAT